MNSKRYKPHEVLSNLIVDTFEHQTLDVPEICELLDCKNRMINNLSNKLVRKNFHIRCGFKNILRYMSEEICFESEEDEKALKEYILYVLHNVEGK